MSPYATYPQVWQPPQNWELLTIRVPSDQVQLSRPSYKRLLSERIEWMIQRGLEHSGGSQVQTQRQLVRALSHLLSYQEPPPLVEPEPLWIWTSAWAETFVEHNEVLMQKLAVDFPILIGPSNPQWVQQAIAAHDAITLEHWLSHLSEGLTSHSDF